MAENMSEDRELEEGKEKESGWGRRARQDRTN
jgi:hypothetical protein